jgi:DNA-directed RNA polymerase subunit RPC12/RpoP
MTTEAPIKNTLRAYVYKGCRRCGGDLVLDREAALGDRPTDYEYVCLQCGRGMPLPRLALVGQAPEDRAA